jgi:hypothetical protein
VHLEKAHQPACSCSRIPPTTSRCSGVLR